MKIYSIILLIFLSAIINRAQTVYEPVTSEVYNLLEILAMKNIAEVNDFIRPLSRLYIYEKLTEAKRNNKNLSRVKKEEVEFWLDKLSFEKKTFEKDSVNKETKTYFLGSDKRFSLAEYYSDKVAITFDVMGGVENVNYDGKSYFKDKYGNKLYGYISDNIGFNISLLATHEWESNIESKYFFSDETGVEVHDRLGGKGIGYSDFTMNLSFDWSWGTLTFGKGHINEGIGKSGNITMSNRAPSFPYIRLDLKITDWLSYDYYHGWLSSDLPDSNSIYKDDMGGTKIYDRQKFIASHSFILKPFQNTIFAAGESVVYSDRLEYAYLIPIMIYTPYERENFDEIGSLGNNLQWFFNITTRDLLPNTQLYGNFFWDEITTADLFDPEKRRLHIAFNLGASVVDFPMNDLRFDFEYARVNPFCYQHTSKATDYTNSSFLMGHWIGQNADIAYTNIEYVFIRGLRCNLWFRYIRKGEPGSVQDQYSPIPQPDFLSGLRKNYTDWGVNLKYEFFHDLTAFIKYYDRNISTQNESGTFTDKKIKEFSFGLYYGH